jgi:hypothetical protein
MRTGSRRERLAGLDARIVPVVAAGIRGLNAGLLAIAGSKGRVGRRVVPWIRREPVIVVALFSVAFAAVLLAVTGGDSKTAVKPSSVSSGPLLTDGRLGPATGGTVSKYVDTASQRRTALDDLSSTQRVNAVVDLTGYLTAGAVDQLLAATPGIDLLRGFARVSPPAQAPIHVLITSPQAGLAAGLGSAHDSAQAVALHYEHELDRALEHPSTQLQEKLQAGAVTAAVARVDAQGLASGCGCVFALVVRGSVAQLEQLAQAAAVRVLDPAPAKASLASLMIVPLEPQVTGTVPALDFAGD